MIKNKTNKNRLLVFVYVCCLCHGVVERADWFVYQLYVVSLCCGMILRASGHWFVYQLYDFWCLCAVV